MSKAEKPPLPKPADLRRLQWLLGSLLVLISAGTVLFLEIEAWGLLACILGAGLLVLFRADLPARIPAWAHRLAFPVIVCLFGWELWSGSGLLPSMVRLCLWLLLYRAICHRTRREELQLILLGLFLIVVAGVLTISVSFVLLLVLFALCALSLLLVVTTGDSLAGPAEDEVYWWHGYSVRGVLRRTREFLDWRQLAGGLGLFGLLVGASAVIFVMIPRVQMENSLFLEQLFPRKATTGFSDSIRFGEVTEISQDQSLAFTLDLPQGELPPPAPYFRMQVLDEYLEGGGFRVSAGLRREAFATERNIATIEGPPHAQSQLGVPWIVYLETGVARSLPLPGAYNRVRLRDATALRHASGLRLIQLRDDPLSMVPYRIEGAIDSRRLEDSSFAFKLRQYPEDSRQRAARRLFLELPADAASRVVLERLLSEMDLRGREAAEFCERAASHLVSHHGYALSSAVPTGQGDTLVRWMASPQPGHCELFASSLVLLARAAGHPARVVVGFRGGTWNAFSNSLSLRNRDAHAWCEVWDGHGAWLRVDPTPGAGNQRVADTQGSRGAPVETDRSLTARFEGLRVLWYRRIVNFDQQTQMEALQSARQGLQAFGQWLGERVQSLRREAVAAFASSSRVAAISVAGVALLLAVLLSWLVLRYRRRWRWSRGRSGNRRLQDPVRREAGRWLRRLQKEGLQGAVYQDLECLRFGPPEAWPAPAETFARVRVELRRSRKQKSA